MSNAQLAGGYYTDFQAKKSVIDNLLATPDGTSVAVQEIRALKRSLTDATAFLPTYDQRRYQDQIKGWERILAERGNGAGDVVKKPRFAFKKKKESAGSEAKVDSKSRVPEGAIGGTEAVVPTLPADQNASGHPSSAQVSLRGMTDRRINLDHVLSSSSDPTSQRTGFSLVLEDIQGCLIDLRQQKLSAEDAGPRLTAVYGANVRDSMVLVPDDMAGSVMLDRVERVVVVAGCQQFRVHSSQRSLLLLHIPSNPIIEHSSSLRFGPYPASLRRSMGTSISSKHDQVQDFGWIKPGPSPNFETVGDDTAERVGRQIEDVLELGAGEGWQDGLAGILDSLL